MSKQIPVNTSRTKINQQLTLLNFLRNVSTINAASCSVSVSMVML